MTIDAYIITMNTSKKTEKAKMYKLTVIACLMLTLTVAAESKFAGLDQLLGRCWQASFPDGKKIDTHCFSEVYQGAFIKDQHIVCGEGQRYLGETWYVFDNKSNTVTYRYYNSYGGISDGSVRYEAGVLQFPDEVYEKAGESATFRSTWMLGEGHYTSKMSQQLASADGGWKPVWEMQFKAVDLKQNNYVQREANGELSCQVSP